MTIVLILVLLAAVTVVAAVGSVYAGRRIAPLREASRIDRMTVVLPGLVLVAVLIALALGGPGSNTTCDGTPAPMRENVAAVIAIYAIPSLVIAVAVGFGALVVGSRKVSAIGLMTSLVAAVVDYVALVHSVHICFN